MKKTIITFIFAFSIFGSMKAQYGTEFFWPNFDGEDMQLVVDSIVTRFGYEFNSEIPIEAVNGQRITSFLWDLINQRDVSSEDCDPGLVWFVNENYGNPSMPHHDEAVFFFDNPVVLDEYAGSSLNLRNNTEDYTVQPNRPGITFNEVPQPNFILFALNARCHDLQSPFYIIIVEKDITFTGLIPGPGGPNPIAIPLSPDESKEEHLALENILYKVTPNPATEFLNVDLELNQEEATSLYLINGSSGQLVQTILDHQVISAGEHRYRISLDQITAGIYYAVLQTDKKREFKKIVVVK